MSGPSLILQKPFWRPVSQPQRAVGSLLCGPVRALPREALLAGLGQAGGHPRGPCRWRLRGRGHREDVAENGGRLQQVLPGPGRRGCSPSEHSTRKFRKKTETCMVGM